MLRLRVCVTVQHCNLHLVAVLPLMGLWSPKTKQLRCNQTEDLSTQSISTFIDADTFPGKRFFVNRSKSAAVIFILFYGFKSSNSNRPRQWFMETLIYFIVRNRNSNLWTHYEKENTGKLNEKEGWGNSNSGPSCLEFDFRWSQIFSDVVEFFHLLRVIDTRLHCS